MELSLSSWCHVCRKIAIHYLLKRTVTEKEIGGKMVLIGRCEYRCGDCGKSDSEKTIETVERT